MDLPHYPLPDLQGTLDKLLESVKALQLPDATVTDTERIVLKFAKIEAPGLQQNLKLRADRELNWLMVWSKVKYLADRNSVVVNSSPALYMPTQQFDKKESNWCQHTARIVRAALLYKNEIINIEKIEKAKDKNQLDMSQYRYIYSFYRIPKLGEDTVRSSAKARHIVVAYKNAFYKLEVYKQTKQNKNDISAEILSENQLTAQLQQVIADHAKEEVAIGLLTTDERNNWANAYKDLVQDRENKKSVETIESSMFVVCMDSKPSDFNQNDIYKIASHQPSRRRPATECSQPMVRR